MRIPTLLLVIGSALSLTGCASKLVTLNPPVGKAEAIPEPALAGLWISEDGEDSYLVRESGSEYEISYKSRASNGDSAIEAAFRGRFFKVGGAEFLDIVSVKDDPYQLPVHMMVRIWVEGATLRWAYLESDWLIQQAARELATTAGTNDRTVIVSPGEAVRDFLANYGVDSKAYDEQHALRKGS